MLCALLGLSGLGMSISGGIGALVNGVAFPAYLYVVGASVAGLKLCDCCLQGCLNEE